MPSHLSKPPQQARSRIAMKALLDAGLKGIEARGIEGLSMADVAAESGVSIGSLYFRFGGKSQFVAAALSLALDDLDSRGHRLMERAARQKWNERRLIENWIAMFVDVIRERRVLVREMVRHAAAQQQSWDPILERRRGLEIALIDYINKCRGAAAAAGWVSRLQVGLQVVLGSLVHMLLVNPGPMTLDDPNLKQTLCNVLFSYLGEGPGASGETPRHRTGRQGTKKARKETA